MKLRLTEPSIEFVRLRDVVCSSVEVVQFGVEVENDEREEWDIEL